MNTPTHILLRDATELRRQASNAQLRHLAHDLKVAGRSRLSGDALAYAIVHALDSKDLRIIWAQGRPQLAADPTK